MPEVAYMLPEDHLAPRTARIALIGWGVSNRGVFDYLTHEGY